MKHFALLIGLVVAGSAFGQNTIQVFKSNGGAAVAAAPADFTLVGANSVNIHPAVAGFATDWFIRQTAVADAIDTVNFTVPQATLDTLNPATVFHVTVGSNTT